MNAAISFPHSAASGKVNLDHLMVELDHYRRESEWLKQVNALHSRLAGATDLQGMVEAFSVWLVPLVSHDLIAFQEISGSRGHMFCSCHGPERRKAMAVAGTILERDECQGRDCCHTEDGFYIQQWKLQLGGKEGCLMILRREEVITEDEVETLNKSKEILEEPLQRALDFENLFEQARRDSLTGLANRRVFEERIDPMLETARRHGHPITVASMDLDHFKQVNDNLGHAVGDEALRRIAKTFSRMVRNSDLLVRMGGDEFVLVLPNTDGPAARILAERLCRAIDNLEISAGDGGNLGVSIGLIQWNNEMSKEEWLQRADEILYQAKKEGRCRVCIEHA